MNPFVPEDKGSPMPFHDRTRGRPPTRIPKTLASLAAAGFFWASVPPLLAQAKAPAKQQQQPPPAEASGEEQETPIELTENTGYNYDAKGRRDPFRSLVSGPVDERLRPPGLAGMLIQEVSLRGIVKTGSGFIAMIQGTDNKSYFARVGERLYDGSIDFIVQDKVVFRQEINDPLRIEKFQKVEKSLYPMEEGKK